MSVIYRQYDSRWGNLSYPSGNTMAEQGCGPTACANVIANISNSSVTPKETRTFMLNKGYAVRNNGTMWVGIPACLKNWGYSVTDCPDMATVWKQCAQGATQGVILFRSGTKEGVTWTAGGHFVAFTDYKIENGKHYFYTRDSGSRKNDGWHCYETTMQGLIPAIWTCSHPSKNKVTCTITYNANGGTNAPAKQVYNWVNASYADAGYINLSSQIPKHSNSIYKFKGWSLDSNTATVKYNAGQKWSLANKGNYTLYAVWQGPLRSITFNANGGSGAPAKVTWYQRPSGNFKLPTTLPVRSGYKFLGWSTNKSDTQGRYAAGSSWGVHNSGDYILYAVWKYVGHPYTGAFPTGTVKQGDTGENVKRVQLFMNWLYNAKLVVDGICGQLTVAQIKRFQKAKGLTVDGICGPKTIAAMKAVK